MKFDYFANALISIWSNKIRSILTVLGVVIGVASVTTLVSLGEGLKKDLANLIQGFGTNVITVVAGKFEPSQSQLGGGNPADFISGDILTAKDLEAIGSRADMAVVSPLSLVPGNLKFNEAETSATVFGSYPSLIDALAVLSIDRGAMFSRRDEGRVVVLGDRPTKALFGELDPIGKKILLGKNEFTVIGTLKKAKSSNLAGSEFDLLAIMPFDTATELNKGQVKIMRIVAKAKDGSEIKQVKSGLKDLLLTNHEGQEDFTVLTQDDILDLFGSVLTLATTLVSAIAAISLIVGGIGIMNIMLVTVTERTREIGLRKAVGATQSAILWQFLIEAIVITFLGSLIGLIISLIIGAIVSWRTDLNATITANVVLSAVGISVVVGVVFGLWPAIRAAKKDPIEALRYE